MSRRDRVRLAAAIMIVGIFASCGGGSSSTTSFTSTPATPAALTITTIQLANAVVGLPYTGQLQASNGTAPYTWSATTTMPSWLSLDTKTGTLTGTASAYTSSYVTFAVSDSANPPNTAQKSMYVAAYNALALNGSTPAAVLSLPYSWQTFIVGGLFPYTATIDSGLPPGITFSLQSSIITFQGTPTASGDFTVYLHMKDSATPPQDKVLAVKMPVTTDLAIATMKARSGVIGRAYSDTLNAVNGIAPLQWSATNLPPGITLDAATGAISGMPTLALNFGYFRATVTDSSNPARSASRDIPISVYFPLAFSMSSSVELHVNSNFSDRLFSFGGVPPVSSSVIAGALPPGLQLVDVYQSVQGTPTQMGVYTPTIRVQDSDTPPGYIDKTFTMTVLPALPVISDQALPGATLGKPYSAKLWARDGTLPYHWTIYDGQLPPGVALDDAGNIAGTPNAVPAYQQAYNFTAMVTDSATPPQSAKRQFSIAVAMSARGRNDSIATATPLDYPGADASLSPFADPADSATSVPDSDYYRVVGNAGTKVSIYVGSNNSVDPVIEIVDANGQRYKTCRDVADDNPTLSYLVKDTTPNAYDDECLNDDIDPTVNLSASLEFLVPGAAGTQLTFYVHVFDSSGRAQPDMQYHISAYGIVSPLRISSTRFPDAGVGVAYVTQLQGGGGTYPLSWQLAPGSAPLPPGLTISQDPSAGWKIGGTATSKGIYTFTIQLSDAANPPQSVTRTFSLNVSDPLLILADKFADLKVGQAYSYTIPTSGGVTPLVWTFYSGQWCCITLNQSTGEWTGSSPGITGTFTGTVGITDAAGKTASKTMTLTVVP